MTRTRPRALQRLVPLLLAVAALLAAIAGPTVASAADPAPTLTVTGLRAHYHSGGKISLAVTQTPDTGNTHYHWYATCPGRPADEILSGAKLTVDLTASSRWHDCSIVAKLFGDGHAVVAASAPQVIDIDDHGPSPALPQLAVTGAKAHYHSGDPIELAAARTPADAPGTLTWNKQCAADTRPVAVPDATATFGVAASPEWNGCRVIARLVGHAPYDVLAEADPVAIAVDDHGHGGDEPATTLTAQGLQDHYRPGDAITLTAAQDPATDLHHYHWFVRCAGGDWTIDPNNATGTWTTAADLRHEGCDVQVKLYDDAHDVVAESVPVTLRVRADAATPPHADPPAATPVVPAPGVPAPAATIPAARKASIAPSGVRRASVLRRQRVLRSVVRLDGRGRVTVRATIPAAAAKRLGLRVPRGARTVALGTARATKTKPGSAVVRIALGAGQRKALARLRGSLRITLVATVRSSDGTTTTARTSTTVRR